MLKWIALAVVLSAIAFGVVSYLHRYEQTHDALSLEPGTSDDPAVITTTPQTPAAPDHAAAPMADAVEHTADETSTAPATGALPSSGDRLDAVDQDTEAGQAIRPLDALDGRLTVDLAWARETIASRPATAAYMILTNYDRDFDRLIGARSPDAASVSVHRTVVRDGVAAMEPAAAPDLEPGVPIVFEPGGLHFMITGLDRVLTPGDTLTLILDLEKAGTVSVEIPVGEPQDIDSAFPLP